MVAIRQLDIEGAHAALIEARMESKDLAKLTLGVRAGRLATVMSLDDFYDKGKGEGYPASTLEQASAITRLLPSVGYDRQRAEQGVLLDFYKQSAEDPDSNSWLTALARPNGALIRPDRTDVHAVLDANETDPNTDDRLARAVIDNLQGLYKSNLKSLRSATAGLAIQNFLRLDKKL